MLQARISLLGSAAILALCAPLASQQARAQAQHGFGICVPRTHETSGVGCFIVTEDAPRSFGATPVFWHVTRLQSRASSDSVRESDGTVLTAFGRTWLMTLGDSAWLPRAGDHLAAIGPLPIQAGTQYKALYMEASMRPGMKSAIHRHSGPEAWYTFAGQTCLETPDGTQVGRAGGPPVIVPGGPPMELTATGTRIRRSIVLILHDAAQPPTAMVTTWKPRHLCEQSMTSPRVTKSLYGHMPDGASVEGFTIRNDRGTTVHVIEYGGIITSIRVPDRAGKLDDVVLGFDSLSGYLNNTPYFGAIVGRYANRIAKGRFTIDGQTYQVPINNGQNSLHGGNRGLDKVVWHGEPFQNDSAAGVVLTYSSPDGDQGYPGRLDLRVRYTLDDRNELAVEYHATTTKPTPVNLSQHSYFNLVGGARRDILGHIVQLNASRYTPVDTTLIPTGELAPVAGTPFDFHTPTAIGARIGSPNEQLKIAGGYDHNWVLDHTGSGQFHAAHVVEPTTGRTLDIYTDQPGLQFYSGNFLDGTIHGKGGQVYGHRYGFAMETQHFPDSPNHPNFPSTILRPGQQFNSRTVFVFGVAR